MVAVRSLFKWEALQIGFTRSARTIGVSVGSRVGSSVGVSCGCVGVRVAAVHPTSKINPKRVIIKVFDISVGQLIGLEVILPYPQPVAAEVDRDILEAGILLLDGADHGAFDL